VNLDLLLFVFSIIETAELLREAREIVTDIADMAGRDEHRESFIGRADVQRLLVDI
jgi:hypothetical protein